MLKECKSEGRAIPSSKTKGGRRNDSSAVYCFKIQSLSGENALFVVFDAYGRCYTVKIEGGLFFMNSIRDIVISEGRMDA